MTVRAELELREDDEEEDEDEEDSDEHNEFDEQNDADAASDWSDHSRKASKRLARHESRTRKYLHDELNSLRSCRVPEDPPSSKAGSFLWNIMHNTSPVHHHAQVTTAAQSAPAADPLALKGTLRALGSRRSGLLTDSRKSLPRITDELEKQHVEATAIVHQIAITKQNLAKQHELLNSVLRQLQDPGHNKTQAQAFIEAGLLKELVTSIREFRFDVTLQTVAINILVVIADMSEYNAYQLGKAGMTAVVQKCVATHCDQDHLVMLASTVLHSIEEAQKSPSVAKYRESDLEKEKKRVNDLEHEMRSSANACSPTQRRTRSPKVDPVSRPLSPSGSHQDLGGESMAMAPIHLQGCQSPIHTFRSSSSKLRRALSVEATPPLLSSTFDLVVDTRSAPTPLAQRLDLVKLEADAKTTAAQAASAAVQRRQSTPAAFGWSEAKILAAYGGAPKFVEPSPLAKRIATNFCHDELFTVTHLEIPVVHSLADGKWNWHHRRKPRRRSPVRRAATAPQGLDHIARPLVVDRPASEPVPFHHSHPSIAEASTPPELSEPPSESLRKADDRTRTRSEDLELQLNSDAIRPDTRCRVRCSNRCSSRFVNASGALRPCAARSGEAPRRKQRLRRLFPLDLPSKTEPETQPVASIDQNARVGTKEEEAAQEVSDPQTGRDDQPPDSLETVQRYYAKGLDHHKNNQLDQAIACYQKAIDANGQRQFASLHINLGSALMAMERFKEALECFQVAESIQPANVKALFNAALALVHLGSLQLATAKLRHVLQLDPSHEKARFALEATTKREAEATAAAD